MPDTLTACLPDALARVLGGIVADQKRDFNQAFELFEAETRALLAEQRAQNIELQRVAQEMVAAQIRRVDERLASIVVKDGQDGRDGEQGLPGRDGKDFDPAVLEATVVAHVAKAIAELPPPKDGERGLQGPQGEPGEKGLAGERGEKGEPGQDGVNLAGAFQDRSGALILTLSDGTARDVGNVAGRDGKDGEPGPAGRDGKDGRDGVSFDDLEIIDDCERSFLIRCARGENVREWRIRKAGFFDRGVYKAGTKYEQGDAVSFGGSLWIAQRDTDAKPGNGDDWRLAVKHGRDGRDGEKGPKGDKGDPGKDLVFAPRGQP